MRDSIKEGVGGKDSEFSPLDWICSFLKADHLHTLVLY